MEYVALDLETTGFDPDWDRVIEVGAVAFTADGVQDRLERLANPGRSVPEVLAHAVEPDGGIQVVLQSAWLTVTPSTVRYAVVPAPNPVRGMVSALSA